MDITVKSNFSSIKYKEIVLKGLISSTNLTEIVNLTLTNLKIDNIKHNQISAFHSKLVPNTNKIEEIPIKDFSTQIGSLPDGCFITLKCELSFEISMILSISISYLAPIFIILLFYFSISSHSLTQNAACLLSIFHYAKRFYETNFVNTYQGRMNLSSLFGLLFYYWILFGVFVSLNIYNTSYTNQNSSLVVIILSLVMLFCEYENYTCHGILLNIKKNNNGKRGLPKGNMYEYVTSAHYFWELMSWFSFFLLTRTVMSFIFVITSFLSMNFMAQEKHKEYIRLYEGKVENKKAIIPFVI